MIVQCPKCKTSYKISEELLKNSMPAFRCSRCKHTFQLEDAESFSRPAANPPSAQLPAAGSREDDELKLSFPVDEKREHTELAAPFAAAPAGETMAAETASDREGPWIIGGGVEKPASQPATAEVPEAAQTKDREEGLARPIAPASAERDREENVLRLGSYQDQQASTKPYLTLFALLVIAFGLVTAFNQAHPTATEEYIRQIPLVGTSVLKNEHLKDGVLLQSVQGGYQSIQGNREVFVISGTALNQNTVTIRGVKILGRGFNKENVEVEKETIWLGNAISPGIVRGMTLQEISNLQRLQPLRSFEIPPGDSVPFTIVLLKTRKGLQDFDCQVIAAEGDA